MTSRKGGSFAEKSDFYFYLRLMMQCRGMERNLRWNLLDRLKCCAALFILFNGIRICPLPRICNIGPPYPLPSRVLAMCFSISISLPALQKFFQMGSFCIIENNHRATRCGLELDIKPLKSKINRPQLEISL